METPRPEILFSDAIGWWVNKPAGWLSVDPTQPGPAPVLARWLESTTGQRVWPVHRLDRETSGVIFFAASADAHREVGKWFEMQQVRKRYRFLASGVPALPSWVVRTPIDGKDAITQFDCDEVFGARAFSGSARPRTGRRHQIRIHAQRSGHALLGDRDYGGACAIATRVALHAERLEFPGRPAVAAPLPGEWNAWVEQLRSGDGP